MYNSPGPLLHNQPSKLYTISLTSLSGCCTEHQSALTFAFLWAGRQTTWVSLLSLCHSKQVNEPFWNFDLSMLICKMGRLVFLTIGGRPRPSSWPSLPSLPRSLCCPQLDLVGFCACLSLFGPSLPSQSQALASFQLRALPGDWWIILV